MDISVKPVEKKKKSIHVLPFVDRRNPDLHGYLYLALDRRKQGNEHLFRGICNSKRGNPDDAKGKLKPAKTKRFASYNLRDDEMRMYPASDYELMHMD